MKMLLVLLIAPIITIMEALFIMGIASIACGVHDAWIERRINGV